MSELVSSPVDRLHLSSDHQCHACGSHNKPTTPISTGTKRSSSMFSSSLQDPCPKRANTLNNDNINLHGFFKLQEPVTTPSPAKPPLYRTCSDHTGSSQKPISDDNNNAIARTTTWSPNMLKESDNSLSPATMKPKSDASPPHNPIARTTSWSPNMQDSLSPAAMVPLQESAVMTPSPAKPPLVPQPLHRTYSDPTGSSLKPKSDATPPHNPIVRTTSWSPNMLDSLSPATMKLKELKDGMREISQWCNQMIQEQADQDETVSQVETIQKEEEAKTATEAPSEEAVWVERMGDCLILHFKCPCGKGYEILLKGSTCYYKLTKF